MCVFFHVADDATGSSYRSTRAYAYVYLWRRTCFFVIQHLKQGTGKPEKKAPAIMTRSAEFTNARYEDVMRTDTQCIFPPPSPKFQCWFSSLSRLPPTLNSRGAGFLNVHVRYLALKQRGLFFGFTGLRFVHSKAFCPPPIISGLPVSGSCIRRCFVHRPSPMAPYLLRPKFCIRVCHVCALLRVCFVLQACVPLHVSAVYTETNEIHAIQ